jgi:hypothetical protein
MRPGGRPNAQIDPDCRDDGGHRDGGGCADGSQVRPEARPDACVRSATHRGGANLAGFRSDLRRRHHPTHRRRDRAPNFTIRQDSGNWNALGAVRIDMPNPYSVYMHDTTHKELFSADYRFQSSGCTRVEDPRAFATWLLADNPGWSRREIDAGIAKGERTDIRLAHKVPVAWVYLTGWVTRDQTIHFRDDVYGHDAKPALVADARPQIASAARASGFVLQSAAPRPPPVRPVSYLDSQ